MLYSLATELGSSLDYLLFGSGAGPGAGRDGDAGADPGSSPGPAVAAGSGQAKGAGAPPPAIVQRGGGRKIIDLASGVRWERLTPAADAGADFLEVIYSPGGHSTDERRPLRHDGREYGLIISGTLQANVGFESYERARATRSRSTPPRRTNTSIKPAITRARDLGCHPLRAWPGLICHDRGRLSVQITAHDLEIRDRRPRCSGRRRS